MSDKNAPDGMEKSLGAARAAATRKPSPPRPAAAGGLANVAKAISPAGRQQAPKPVEVADVMGYDVAMQTGFIGSGQGGSRIAQAFWELGYRRVGAFNTTDSDFAGLDRDMPKLSLEIGGAAKDAAFARQAIDGSEQEVWDLLRRALGTRLDCVLVCASLGGGTGSGTVAKLVQMTRKYMESNGLPSRVGCIISIPPVGEGQQQAKNAVTAFRQLLEVKASPIVVIDNARINELYKPGMLKLHSTANETVAQLFNLFNRLAAVRSNLITFDRSEFAQLLDGGVVSMSYADIDVEGMQNPADVSTAIREQIANSVLAAVDLRTGKKAGCLFVAPEEVLDRFNLDFFDAGYTQLDRIVGSAYDREKVSTVIHRGLYVGDEPGLQCYTMISELDPPYARLAELARKAGMTGAAAAASSIAGFLGVND